MANKMTLLAAPNITAYALIFNSDGQVWNGSAFETYSAASIGNYDVPFSQQGSGSGVYTATFPAGITGAGEYHIAAYEQAGGSPDSSDTRLGAETKDWDGTGFVGRESFFARIKFTRDPVTNRDKYTVIFYFYGKQVFTEAVTSPTLTILNRNGTTRTATTPLVKVAGTPIMTYEVTDQAARVQQGEDAVAVVVGTVGGSARSWSEVIGRDSVAV